MSAYTPGPWLMARHGAVIGGVTRQYTNGVGQDQIAMACHMQDDNGSQLANAHLIAAAPDLLYAAKLVLAWYEAENDFTKEPDFYKRVEMCRVSEVALRAAIAKATGGEL